MQEFINERNNQYSKRIDDLLNVMPSFFKEFYIYNKGANSELTLYAYLIDLKNFLEYERQKLKSKDIKNISLEVLSSLSVLDFEDYKIYISDELKLTSPTIRRQLGSLSAYYNFLLSRGNVKMNPLTSLRKSKPGNPKIVHLDSKESKDLLSGIKSNSKYAELDKASGEYIVHPLSGKRQLDREKLVSRNYAIAQLLLGSGIRVSELVGLDLGDVHLKSGSITVIRKGGKQDRVYFDEITNNALQAYIYGEGSFEPYKQKYGDLAYKYIAFVKKNATNPNIRTLAIDLLDNSDSTFLNDIEDMAKIIRAGGRDALKPKSGCNALFLSNRGTRMSVRMVETMIKEAAIAYLGDDCRDKTKISPHKLRATCATRILKQTDNIALAQRQLGHASSNTTSRYYAELEDEMQKLEIQRESSLDW